MVGMLIFHHARREHCTWTDTADNFRQFDGVGGADFQMRVTIEFDELNRRAKNFRRRFRLGRPLFGRAVRARFAA